jgi:hypothetical protein
MDRAGNREEEQVSGNWYETIKETAKARKMRVGDLIALAPKNDPFYTGRPGEVKAAEWFAEVWRDLGYSHNVHLRRIHYQLVSQDPPREMPNGEVYQNTHKCWQFLNNASKWARYLRKVDVTAFVDRRNKDPIQEHAYWQHEGDWSYQDPTPRYDVNGAEEDGEGWDDLDLPDVPALDDISYGMPDTPKVKARGYDDGLQQDYHVEIWAEKTTMDDVLGPICSRTRTNLVRGAGELSITMVMDFMQRVRRSKRPARIGYVSDFDPAGLGMPISVARKIEFFQRAFGFLDLDIKLEPIALTAEQVEEFSLPRVPVKDTDTRKAGWERDHGKGQVELDALEALHPGSLADIVASFIKLYHDEDLLQTARKERKRLQEHLEETLAEVLEEWDIQEERESLEQDWWQLVEEWDALQEEWAEHVKAFQEKIDAHESTLAELKGRGKQLDSDIEERVRDLAADPEEEYPLPDPDLEDDGDDQLYVSGLEYTDQLVRYKRYRHGG